MSDQEASPEIIESCRQGDRDAFRALYEAYKDRVYSIALYFFHGDRASAADATQQVFLKLLHGIAQFRGDAGFSTWLYRMVVNTCMDAARHSAKSPGAAARVPNFQHDPGDSQEAGFMRAEIAHSVQTAVSSLPSKLRLAILLRYFDDLSYDEMAKALGCSMGTVASRLSRGHRMLAEKLAVLGGKR